MTRNTACSAHEGIDLNKQTKQKEIKPKPDKLDKRDIFWYNDSTDEQELRSVIGFNDDRFVKNNQDCSDLSYN